jgi:hypothetical protein
MKLTSMFQNNPKTKIGIITFVTLLLVAFCTHRAHSSELERDSSTMKIPFVSSVMDWKSSKEFAPPFYNAPPSLNFALGSAVVRESAPVIGLTVNYPDRIGDIDYEFGFNLIGATGRINNNFGVHARVIDGWGPVRLGFGIAYLQHTDWINGSNLNFNLLAGYHISRRFTLDYGHWSNAGTVMPNLGRDYVTLNYRY